MDARREAGPRPAPRVDGVAPYRVAKHPAPIDLHLDGNEGAAPPPELVGRLLGRAAELIRRYPDAAPLAERVAAALGARVDGVLITSGADEAIERTCRALLAPGREIVIPVPSFEMIERYARLADAAVVEVPWPEGPFPVDAVLGATGPGTGVIAVVSPNNPTGAVATADDLRRLSAAAPHAVLLVDLAYGEFAADDLTAAALALPNAIVARTFSKAWGMAGLRVGYAAGPPAIVEWLRAAGSPYSVAGLSMALAAAWLDEGGGAVRRFAAVVRDERERLEGALARLGAAPVPSQANFVLARFRDAGWVRDALAGLGIAVRRFSGRPSLEDALRITCPGDAAALERVEGALAAALRPQALLFDLDGVIADVSRSYRQAILQTAAAYGVAVDPAEISAAKARGGANNDWVLTRELLAAHGVDAALDEVTERFERLYQGTGDAPGLRLSERLLVPREALARLAARLPLAVVTGRPRADAERFLREHGVADLFRTVVALEDGPGKPDPAPVRTALSRLGVSCALMVGDTADDVRAARAAGVVPLAVVAPGDDPERQAGALLATGAARVLSSIEELEEILP